MVQTIVGTDVADLLLEDHEPNTEAYTRTGLNITTLDTRKPVDSVTSPGGQVTVDKSVVAPAQGLQRDEFTDRFRNLLLHGQKKVHVGLTYYSRTVEPTYDLDYDAVLFLKSICSM